MIKYSNVLLFMCYSIVIVSFLNALSLHPNHGSSIYLYFWFLLVVLSYIFVFLAFPYSREKLSESVLFFIFLVSAYFFVSLFFSMIGGYASDSLRRFLMISIPTLSVIILMTLIKREQLKLLTKYISSTMVLVSCILSLIAFYLLVAGRETFNEELVMIQELTLLGIKVGQYAGDSTGALRVSSLTSNANIFGGALMLSFISLVYLQKTNFSWFSNRWLGMLALLLLFLGFGLTFSRTSIVATIVGTCVYFLISTRRIIYKFFILMSLLFLVLTFIIFIVFSGLGADGADRLSTGLSGRDNIWGFVLPKLISNPLSGIGIGVTDLYLIESGSTNSSLHNAYLNILLETGVLGLFIYFSLVFFVITKVYKKIKITKSEENFYFYCFIISILASMLMHQFAESSAFQFGFFHIFLIYFLYVGVRVKG